MSHKWAGDISVVEAETHINKDQKCWNADHSEGMLVKSNEGPETTQSQMCCSKMILQLPQAVHLSDYDLDLQHSEK